MTFTYTSLCVWTICSWMCEELHTLLARGARQVIESLPAMQENCEKIVGIDLEAFSRIHRCMQKIWWRRSLPVTFGEASEETAVPSFFFEGEQKYYLSQKVSVSDRIDDDGRHVCKRFRSKWLQPRHLYFLTMFIQQSVMFYDGSWTETLPCGFDVILIF